MKAKSDKINIDTLLLSIAKQHLFVETLETRRSDGLDFHDVSVWGIKAALLAAYEAGLHASEEKGPHEFIHTKNND